MLTTRRSQNGVSLLLLVFIVLCLSATLFINSWSSNTARLALDARTEEALAVAKEALVGRAATDNNRPGSLPCPDTNGDGVAELFVGSDCPAYIGRLPYKTLKIGELRDASGELLWYALSPSLRDHPSASINSNTPATLNLDALSNVAAIIIAPGPPLSGQNGRPSNQTSDYLDGSNADGDANFASGPFTSAFNDRIIAITQAELFRVVNKRVLGEIRGALTTNGVLQYYKFHANTFPPAGTPLNTLTFDTGTMSWLTDNSWFALVTYVYVPPAAPQLSIGSEKVVVTP
jgi:type II secretory pathway pseudopilin PulG